MTEAETEERNHVAAVTERLRRALENLDARLTRYARSIQEEKAYYGQSKAEMDAAEKAFLRQSIDQSVLTGETVLNHRNRLRKLLLSPFRPLRFRPGRSRAVGGCLRRRPSFHR